MTTLLLSIDTAGSRCAVALSEGASAHMLARVDPDIGRGHAEVLMGLIAGVLAEAGVGYGDVGGIACVVGPGSFTGLRVGVAAAKGLALALDIGCVGVTTLEALAEPHWRDGAPVLSVIDAKRGEVYAALFGADGAVLAEPAALAPDGLGLFLGPVLRGRAGGEPVRLVGSGADIALAVLGDRATRLAGIGTAPDIASVARIAAARTPGGPLRPLYLRGADAKPQAATGVSHVTRPATLP